MLSPKEQLFVQFYHAEGETFKNATKSAIAAGFKAKSAASAGSRLLRKDKVRTAVDAYAAKICNSLEISAKRVLAEIAKLAFANPQDYYNSNGSPKEIHELTRDQAAALNTIKTNMTDECAVLEIKLHDKGQNLERLGRHLKLFTDKVEVTTSEGLAEAIEAARRRARGAKGK